MSITYRETLKRHTTGQERLQDTLVHIDDTPGSDTLAVIAVIAIQVRACITGECRVGHHIERRGQNALAHHILKSLSTLLQAMSLKAMSEYLMEEHAAGCTREDGRSCIGIGDRCLLQGP